MSRLLAVLCLGAFASSIAWRAIDPILPVIASDLNVSLADAVLLSSAYSISLAAMLLVFGPIGDAWGKVRVMRISLLVVALSLGLMAVSPDYPVALASRIVSGAFAVGGMTFGFLVRRLLSTLGPWRMMRAGGVIAGTAMMATALPIHWGMIAVLFLFIGLGFYMLHSTVQLHVTELAPQARGAGVSVGAFSFWCGQGLGPIGWSVVVQHFGYAPMFVIAGLLTIVLGFWLPARLSLRGWLSSRA